MGFSKVAVTRESEMITRNAAIGHISVLLYCSSRRMLTEFKGALTM